MGTEVILNGEMGTEVILKYENTSVPESPSLIPHGPLPSTHFPESDSMTTTILPVRSLRKAALSMSVLGLLLPATAWAEGGVRLLECETSLVCDAAGSCDAASDQVTFTMEPLAVDASGAGDWQISYADERSAMSALSEAGPFFWVAGTERNTLLASSETEFLWHGLDLGEAVTARVRFLSCELRQ